MQFSEQELLQHFTNILSQISDRSLDVAQQTTRDVMKSELIPIQEATSEVKTTLHQNTKTLQQHQHVQQEHSEQIASILTELNEINQRGIQSAEDRVQQSKQVDDLLRRIATIQLSVVISIVLNIVLVAILVLR